MMSKTVKNFNNLELKFIYISNKIIFKSVPNNILDFPSKIILSV